MNIDEMPAGREMDALIAEKVMGSNVSADNTWQKVYNQPDEFVETTTDKKLRRTLQPYSTDIAAAWEVVEKLSRENYFVSVCQFPKTSRSNVHIQKVNGQGGLNNPIQLQSETVPLAICRAALKAVGASL